MTQPGTPQARQAIKNTATIGIGVIRTIGLHHQPGVSLEFSIAGVRHPVRLQPIGVGSHANFGNGFGINGFHFI